MSRRRLTPAEKRRILERQEYICGCGCGLSALNREVEWDHRLPLALGGADHERNIDALLPGHHKAKTAEDIRQIRKADRQRRAHEEGRGRKRRGRKLQGRGFTGWRNFKGEIVRKGDD